MTKSTCRSSSIDLEEAARGFAAIGSEPRLDVLLALVRAGPAGLSVGEIQARLDIPASTLAHHLKFLAAADLIEQRRKGRTVLNRAAYAHLEALAAFLLRECCSDSETATMDSHVERETTRTIQIGKLRQGADA
ncbi:MAG: metalloregulator ArsR/SmtB family transcription factor [Pseudomonadota bacterium]